MTQRQGLFVFSDLELMVGNFYGEARQIENVLQDEIREYLAIGGVVRNRVMLKGFPNTVKEVILQPRQFSWTNDNDPNLDQVLKFLKTKKPNKYYERLSLYAQAILDRKVRDFSEGADHYMALWLYEDVKPSHWARRMQIRAIHGGHIFLRSWI